VRRSRNQGQGNRVNAEGAEVLAKAAEHSSFAFLCPTSACFALKVVAEMMQMQG
jgi:hypothetical protein